MTSRQLHSIYRIALSNTKQADQFAFAFYDELYKFDRKQAINFLLTGVGDDFFDGKLSREAIISLVGKFYHPTWEI